jgi:hypothetical protein
VANKQDTVNAQEREDALKFVAERLKQLMSADTSQIFSISARKGLQAKLLHNRAELGGSGILPFKTELLRFLTEERAQSFLVNMYERTMGFLMQKSRSVENPEHEESYRALIGRLRDLREIILSISNQPEKAIVFEQDATASRYSLQIDKKTGCRVCGSVLEAISRFLSKYQYELTFNPKMQQEHARRGGFCPLHTWQYEGISSPQGVCEAYPRLVHSLATELKELATRAIPPGESRENIDSLLPTTKTCCICEVRIEAERRAVEEIAAVAQRVPEANCTRVSACCLPHLRMVIEILGPGEPARELLRAQANLLERTAEDLQRYALKHDALRRHLTSEEERSASQLALLLLAGHRNVSAPWVIDYIL